MTCIIHFFTIIFLAIQVAANSSVFDLSCIDVMFPIDGPTIVPASVVDRKTLDLMERPVGAKRKSEVLVSALPPQPSNFLVDESVQCLDTFKKSSATGSTPKKPRTTIFSNLSPQMTVKQIIDQEIKSFKKPERKEMYRIALEFISVDNIDGFKEISPEFKEVFNICRLKDFKSDEAPFYIYRFMILFGAKNFAKEYGGGFCGSYKKDNFFTIEMFRYLIANSPIDSVLAVLTAFPQIQMSEEMVKEITDTINEKYPDLDFFLKNLVKVIGKGFIRCWSYFIAPLSDVEKFKNIANATLVFDREAAIPVLAEMILKRPEIYVQLSQDEKFKFIRMVILSDDVEKLRQILEFDPEMLLFRETGTIYSFGGDFERNIIDETVQSNSTKCFRFLVQIIPELLTINDNYGTNSLVRTVFCPELDFLNILLEFDYSLATSTFHYKEFENMNLAALAYYYGKPELIKFFLEKLGVESFSQAIQSVWSDQNSLIEAIFNGKFGNIIPKLELLVDTLKIVNFNGPFTYKGKTGTLKIFVDYMFPDSMHVDLANFLIKHQ